MAIDPKNLTFPAQGHPLSDGARLLRRIAERMTDADSQVMGMACDFDATPDGGQLTTIRIYVAPGVPPLPRESLRVNIPRDEGCDACMGKVHDALGGQYLDGEDDKEESAADVTIDGHWTLCKPHRRQLAALLPLKE